MKNVIKLNSAISERGISLIEGVLYLVIALSVIVGGIVFFQQAQLSSNVTDMARAGVSMSSETRGLFQNQRGFGTDNITGALVSAGAVPSNFESADGEAIIHPFGGGNVAIKGYDTHFGMALGDLSEEACIRLASVGATGQGSLGTGITGILVDSEVGADDAGTVTGGSVASPSGGAIDGLKDESTLPYGAADAAGDCGDGVGLFVMYAR